MAELDAELLERVARWCAEAGRQAGAREIRRALAPLAWDELLAVRALLADPPPARPLGPQALADIARGAPADLAAEREREGRYPAEPDDAPPPAAPPAPPRASPRRRSRAEARPSLVIRRARDREPAVLPAAPERPSLDDLLRPEGRAELERLVRRLGARRRALATALAERWRRADGAAPDEDDVAALLDHHGLARAFARRERDELLHALRAAGGARAAAAERLGLDAAALDAALARLGAAEEAARIREQRRVELRARATLAERVSLLLREEARLRDLDVLAEFEADLRARLPEHVRALRTSRGPLREALAASLSLPPAAAQALAARFGVDLGPGRPAGRPAPPRARPDPRGRGRRGAPPGARPGPSPRGKPGTSPRGKPAGPRGGPGGRPGARRGGGREGGPRRGR